MSTEPKQSGRALRRVALAVEIVLAVVVVVVLWEHSRLRKRYTMLRSRPPVAERFAAGDRLPGVDVVDRMGRRAALQTTAQSRVMIAHPGCGVCDSFVPQLPANWTVVSTGLASETSGSALNAFQGSLLSVAERPRDSRFRRVPQFVVLQGDRIVLTCAEPAQCEGGTAR